MTEQPEELEMQLMRYADGQSSPEEAAFVEALLARDPAAREQVKRWRAQAESLSGAFAPVLDEPVPGRLTAAAQAAPSATILDFSAMAGARRLVESWPRGAWAGGGIAAAAALLIGLWIGGQSTGPSGAAILAQGTLEKALDNAPSGAAVGEAEILFTVATQDGAYCRAFRSEAQDGLACREDGAWRIVALADARSAGTSAYQPAGGVPEAIVAAAQARRSGDPLDLASEQELLRKGWKE